MVDAGEEQPDLNLMMNAGIATKQAIGQTSANHVVAAMAEGEEAGPETVGADRHKYLLIKLKLLN